MVVQVQEPIEVRFRGQVVGNFDADLLVNDAVIVELETVRQLNEVHEVQLVNYLVATGKQVGLLVSFGPDGVDVKRKVRALPHGRVRSAIVSTNPVDPVNAV